MNERIKKLREKSLAAEETISIERAKMLTEYYSSGEVDRFSIPVARAKAFKYILEHKELYLGEDELIVGERGPSPKATPTYPELWQRIVLRILIFFTTVKKFHLKLMQKRKNINSKK